MAKTQKIKTRFSISKENVKQSAYLVISNRELLRTRNEQGTLTIALEDIESSSQCSAWTTLAAAKRQAAASVGRSRLAWVDQPVGENGTMSWTAEYEDKVAL